MTFCLFVSCRAPVTCIHLDLFEDGCILLDGGECSFSQFIRHVGIERLDDVCPGIPHGPPPSVTIPAFTCTSSWNRIPPSLTPSSLPLCLSLLSLSAGWHSARAQTCTRWHANSPVGGNFVLLLWKHNCPATVKLFAPGTASNQALLGVAHAR